MATEEEAVVAEAVSRAYDEWLEEWEDRIVPADPAPGDLPSEVPSFGELVAAPPEAEADLTRRIEQATAAARARLAAPPAEELTEDFGPFAPEEGEDAAP